MYAIGLRCVFCGQEYPLLPRYACNKCQGILEVYYDYTKATNEQVRKSNPLNLLPVKPEKYIDMGQGNTPLVEEKKIATELGIEKLWLKCEFSNPTGSFKDRPVAVGISKAIEFCQRKVIVASSGNAAAAVGAYAARAGLQSIILVPESTPDEKVMQSLFYGARVVRVEGPYSNCFDLAKKLGERLNIFNLTTTFINPYTVEGNKSVAYELFAQMNSNVPDIIYVPIGAGPLLVGIYKGFCEYHHLGISRKRPRMAGIQAEGCSPIAQAFLAGETEVHGQQNPSTIAGGICDGLDGYAQDGSYTLDIIKRSGGFSLAVSDGEIREAQTLLAQKAGIFVEPSAAAAFAGLTKSLRENRIDQDARVVVILTGHGLKDVGRIYVEKEVPLIPNDVQ